MSKLRWRSVVWVGVGVVATWVVSGCGSSAPAVQEAMMSAATPGVVANFAGQTLTLDEFELRYARSVGGWEPASADSMAEYEDFLKRYVDFRLKVIEAKEIGLDEDSSLIAEIDQYKLQLSRPYLIDQEIVEGLVQDLYNRQQEEVSASHILIRVAAQGSPEDTLAAYQRMVLLRDSVLAGTPFQDIAERNSEDPSAMENRGFLGVFSGGRMIKAFEDMAYETPVGEMSDIVRTRFGYHVVQVHSRGPRSPDIRAAHILIRAAEDDTLEAFETMKEVLQKLSEGADFADLAMEYSEDQGSAPTGGDLGTFGRGRMVAPFEQAAFALEQVGDVSPPFRTKFGYHIVKLLEKAGLPTYEEAYDDLKATVQRLPRFTAAQEALAARYAEELGAAIDTTALLNLTSGFSPDSMLLALSLEQWSDDQKATVLATMGGESYTLNDFLEYGMQKRASRPAAIDMAETLSTVRRMLESKSLDVAASRLEGSDSEFKELMDEYRDGIVLFRIMEDSVWNRANTDTVGLMKVYEANAPSYRFSERKRIISFYASSDSSLSKIATDWAPGDTTDWASMFGEEDLRVDTTFVSDSTNSIYDQALSLEPGEASAPIRYRRGFIVLALDGIEAPREKTFKESRADVVTAYQAQVEEEWLDRLHAKYGLVLHSEQLVGAFESSEIRLPEMDAVK